MNPLSVLNNTLLSNWDIFLGPQERARAETGGADQWLLTQKELPGVAIVNGKKRPHPWDTHYHFSIKTLLSKQHTNSHTDAAVLTCFYVK